MDAENLARLARLSEDALRDAARSAGPEEADRLTDQASERASQVEQLRALARPHGATAAALSPAPHAAQTVHDAEAALADACAQSLEQPDLEPALRTLLTRIAASCR